MKHRDREPNSSRSLERHTCSEDGRIKTNWAQKKESNRETVKLSLIKEGMRYIDSRAKEG